MIYLTDGTKECFLTAFLYAFSDENALISSSQTQLALGQESVFVAADAAKAKKAEARLLSFDKDCMNDLFYLLRSGRNDREQIAFRYLKLLTEKKMPVREMAEDASIAANECIRKVTYEIHRMHGFVRFLESASGALYAPLSPDNDIVDLLTPHFRARLPEFPFVLHDVKRKKAAVYDGKNSFLAPLESAEIVLSADEQRWQSLWQRYYQSVNIPQRERLKQMKGYMPVRYWKHMPEFHATDPLST